MERLTKRGPDGTPYYPKCFEKPCEGFGCQKDSCEFVSEVCARLCEHEERQEQWEATKGKMLFPGQTVWIIERDPEHGDALREDVICDMTFHWSPHNLISLWYGTLLSSFPHREIGKTVFTDKAAAERVFVHPEEADSHV